MAQLIEKAGVGVVCSSKVAPKFPLATAGHVAHEERVAEGKRGGTK